MAESTPYILAAAGIVAANEVIFAPIVEHKQPLANFNWKLIPAVTIAGLSLAALEKLSPPLGKGLAVLALLAALIMPFGNAPSPIDNASKALGLTQ